MNNKSSVKIFWFQALWKLRFENKKEFLNKLCLHQSISCHGIPARGHLHSLHTQTDIHTIAYPSRHSPHCTPTRGHSRHCIPTRGHSHHDIFPSGHSRHYIFPSGHSRHCIPKRTFASLHTYKITFALWHTPKQTFAS